MTDDRPVSDVFPGQARAQSGLSVQGSRFVDPEGRQVLLHGVCVVSKDPRAGYLGSEDARTFAAMRDWGLNCIRLGVIWDGLEPEPGAYNEAYLDGIDRQIAMAQHVGLYVYLDMHQDLYSVLYSDGAPAWATLSGDAPHIADSAVWSDAYFTSPAVQAALDRFWQNAPAPDGIGLQEHYARAWGVLAARLGQRPNVIGYDLMNEPFPGALATQAQALMFAVGAKLLAAQGALEGAAVEDVAALWLTPEGRSSILALLADVEVYARVVDTTEKLYAEFERSRLMPMYRRVARVVREQDPNGILFLEGCMACNTGVRSSIEPVAGPDGACDPQQAYAPHGYDLVTDTAEIGAANPERVAFIFGRHDETARRLSMPTMVGEWGAYGRIPGTLGPAREVVALLERTLCSETYWAHADAIERTPSFRAIHRPYPERVAGALLHYRYDPDGDTFSCVWDEDGVVTAPSLVYLPDWFGLTQRELTLAPAGSAYEAQPARPGSGNLLLRIPPTGVAQRRELTIRRK
ncbi:MAG: cellulase family glycosylhydrolase [Anaerolineae bacterium]|nr:cellulase family glycosylhydrolase [Anaerolineae bacterium]